MLVILHPTSKYPYLSKYRVQDYILRTKYTPHRNKMLAALTGRKLLSSIKDWRPYSAFFGLIDIA